MRSQRMPNAAVLFAASLLSIGTHARAAEPEAPPQVLDLAACIARALAASDALRAREAQAEALSRGLDEAKSRRYPGVVLSGSYLRSAEVEGGRIEIAPGTTVDLPAPLRDSAAVRLQLQQTLYAGGRIDASVRAAAAFADAAAAQASSARSAAAGAAEKAYWNLYLAQEGEAAALENLRAMEAHRKGAEDRLARGAATRGEVLSWQLREVQARSAEGSARTRRVQAAASLALLLGLPWDAPVEAAQPPEPEGFGDPASGESSVDVASALRAALAARADVAESRAREEAQSAVLAGVRGALLPSVQLTGSFAYLDPNPKVFPQRAGFEPYWEAGVMASWDVGGLAGNLSRAKEEEANLRAARLRSEALRRNVEMEVVAAAIALEDAERRMEVSATALDLALENRRVAGERYASGIALDAELADAEAALAAARAESAGARVSRELARAALRDATGGSAEELASDGGRL